MDTVLMFRFAKLYNFYFHPIVSIVRVGILVLVIAILIFSIQQSLSTRFPIGILLLFFMTEVFFRMKFATLTPKKTTEEAKESEYADTITLPAAAMLLKPSFLSHKEIIFIMTHIGINPEELIVQNVGVENIAVSAYKIAKEIGAPYVTILEMFAAFLLLTEKETKLLFSKEINKDDLLTILAWTRYIYPQALTVALPKIRPWGAGIGESWVAGWTLETQKFTSDFTRKVLQAPPALIGRDKELEQLIEILAKSKQRNILLVGEPGVGKKTIVETFAVKSFLGDVSDELRFLRILELLSGSLVSGAATAGELEKRLGTILAEISHAGDVILFISEIQNIAGAGSDALDVTGTLLPHLLGSKLRVIATVTPQNYKAFLERRSEFTNAFEKVFVEEPVKQEATSILLAASSMLEKSHHVIFHYHAVISAIELASRYLPEKKLPGKAISLLDEVASRAQMSNKRHIDREDIEKLLEEKLPVKVSLPTKEERRLLLNLEKILHERIVNQEEAVQTVSEAMRRLRSGLTFEGRPVGVFLFLGPTGVGKTETAKALASTYFGSDTAMIRFDMSEYQDRMSATRLVDEITEKVRLHPFSLILLDEFEKAYPSILDLFLSVFEDGRLTDSSGVTVAFDNTLIIATSNAGSELIRQSVARGEKLGQLQQILLESLQKSGIFKPELLNRFDAVILFEPLGEKEIVLVTELLLQKVASLLAKKDIALEFDQKSVAKIAKEAFDPTMGARPLRRYIADHVEDLLSKKLLREEIKRGDTIVLSTDSLGNLTLLVKS